MAAEPGFEPGLRDPKSPVLPLHNSASNAEGRTRTDTEVALQQFLRLPRLPLPPLRLINLVPRPRIELGTRGFSVRQQHLLIEILIHLAALGQVADQLRQTLVSNCRHQQDQVAELIQQLAKRDEHES